MTSRIKIVLSVMVIMVAFVAAIGATFAWFTDSAELVNEFQAGKVSISAEDEWNVTTVAGSSTEWDNANPGECQKKDFEITNDGTKKIFVRFTFDGEWTDYPYENYDLENDPKPSNFPNSDLVTITPAEGFASEWTELEVNGLTYWYYNGLIEPGVKLEYTFEVCLNGPETTNHYQEATYTITFNFEAVQATHWASFDLWDAGYYKDDAWYEVEVDSGSNFIMPENNIAGVWEATDAGEPNYEGWAYPAP